MLLLPNVDIWGTFGYYVKIVVLIRNLKWTVSQLQFISQSEGMLNTNTNKNLLDYARYLVFKL